MTFNSQGREVSISLVSGVVWAAIVCIGGIPRPSLAMGQSAPPEDPESIASIEARAKIYGERYGLKTLDQKRTENRGTGYAALYGTRNFRQVLTGAMYRGGANNRYHHTHPRDNQNPLPDDGLMRLCEQGFERAIYLYSANFSTAPRETRCQTRDGKGSHTLKYDSISPLTDSGLRSILTIVRTAALDPSSGPVYTHCWNGWHASGLASASSLMQFCGFTNSQALAYWERNTDGNDGSEYDHIRKRIRDFKPLSGLGISASARAAMCPK